MILSNFITIAFGYLTGAKSKATTGQSISSYSYFMASSYSTGWYDNTSSRGGSQAYINNIGIVLSDDNTVPTANDYKVNNYYTTDNIKKITGTLTQNGLQLVITFTFQNISDSNLQINTVGLWGTGVGYTDTYRVLLTKTLLDTPVTVAPGETKTITITVDFNSFVENVNA